MSNTNKVWFVTGASSGFGRAIVEEALRRGDSVVAAARSKVELLASDRLLTVHLDVTKQADIDAAVASAIARFGRIDVLVNNAGYSMLGAVEETSEAELRNVMETMFFGATALTRAVLPSMRERGSGTIVQITSMGGITTGPGFSAYCAAKHALEGWSECLSLETKPHGIRVVIVEPGAFRTALFSSAFRRMPEMAEYDSTVGALRRWVAEQDGKQPGDPHKAALAIVDAVGSDDPPLRLPLGADAITGIRQKLALIEADVARGEKIATEY